jgi:hypothetical protein
LSSIARIMKTKKQKEKQINKTVTSRIVLISMLGLILFWA